MRPTRRSNATEARQALATLPAKFLASTVGTALTRIVELLRADGSAPMEKVRAALYPALELDAAKTALRTQIANRLYKNEAGEAPLILAISRKGSVPDVIWFEQPAREDPSDLAAQDRDAGTALLPTNANVTTGAREIAEAQAIFNASAKASELGSLRGIGDTPLTATNATAQQGIHVQPTESSRNIVNALDEMLKWATNQSDAALPLLALLGDYGTGKTSHAQTFSKVINGKIAHPIYKPTAARNAALIDLSYLRGVPGLARLSLTDILHVVIRAQGLETKLTAADLLRDARLGATIFIYDGLDELLGSHQSHSELADIFRQLMQVFSPDPETQAPSRARVIVSCRTHYFRDYADQHQLFDTRQRGQIKASDYLCLYLLPWGEKTVESYLAKRLTQHEAAQLGDIIKTVYDLKSLASRPVLLAMMCEQVGTLIRSKKDGGTITAATLYAETVARWVHRDNAKHVLQATHKPALMGALATAQWSAGAESWTSEALDRWARATVDLLFPNSYAPDKTEAIQDDLRTATFIVRPGVDGFTFAHRSFQEFFIARHLVALLDRDDIAEETLAKLHPARQLNRETIAFFTELLAQAPQHLAARSARLWDWLSNNYGDEKSPAPASHDALFHLALAANITAPSNAKRTNLRGLSLIEARWEKQNFPPLDLRGANLRGLRATGCNLAGMWLDGANLSQSVLRDCNTAEAEWRGAERGGMVVRETADTSITRPIPGPWSRPFPATHQFAVAFSPDGKTFLTGGADGIARLWETATGRPVQVFIGHTSSVQGVAFSPNGKTILTGGDDDTARLWDIATGRELHVFLGHGKAVLSVAFSPDGKTVLSGSADSTARLWDPATGDALRIFSAHDNSVWSVAYHPDQKTILTGSADGTARLWDILTGREKRRVSSGGYSVWGVAFSPDGKSFLTGSSDGIVRVWEDNKVRELFVKSAPDNAVTSVAFSPDGKSALCGSRGSGVTLVQKNTGRILLKLWNHGGEVTSVTFSPDGKTLLIGSLDSAARLYEAATCQDLRVVFGHGNSARGVAFSPDGKYVSAKYGVERYRVWDASSGHAVASEGQMHEKSHRSIGLSKTATISIEHGIAVIRPSSGPQAGHVRYLVDGDRPSTASFDASGALIDFDAEAADTWLYWLGHGTPQPVEAGIAAMEDGERNKQSGK